MGDGGPWAHSPCPPQCGVPAFTVLQPDGPLAVLRDRAQQISVSLIGTAGWGLADWGGTLPFGASVCSSVLVQLEDISVLGTGLGGLWLMGKDGRADGIREGLLAEEAAAAPLTSCCPSPL